jgi:hypothetical protein
MPYPGYEDLGQIRLADPVATGIAISLFEERWDEDLKDNQEQQT